MAGASRSGAALVTTLRGVGASLDSFIAWHRMQGFDRLFLFFDDPADPDLARATAHPLVTAIVHDESLRQAWTRQPEYPAYRDFLDREVMARQIMNVGVAIGLARQAGLDWLLHIDSDELFFSPTGEGMAELARTDADTLIFPNYEAVPETGAIADPFAEVTLFKVPPPHNPGPFDAAGARLLAETAQLQPLRFHFYSNGKSAMRLAANLRPRSVHGFGDQDTRRAVSEMSAVLHYACCGFDAFWRKYEMLGRFDDAWFGKSDIRAAIGPLHVDARDVVAAGDEEKALDFYRRRIAIEDPARAGALVAAGILTRWPQVAAALRSLRHDRNVPAPPAGSRAPEGA